MESLDGDLPSLETLNTSAIDGIKSGDFDAAFAAYRQIIDRLAPDIFVIGDSHVFGYSYPKLMPIWLGPITMHRIGRDRGAPINFQTLGIHTDKIVLFSFGEIDARQHIHAQSQDQNISIQDVCNSLCGTYMEAVSYLTAGFQNRNVFLVTPLPPHDIPAHSPHAFVNAPELSIRIETARILSNTLYEYSKTNNFGIIDVYSAFKNDLGILPDHYTEDDIHIYTKAGQERLAALIGSTLAPVRTTWLDRLKQTYARAWFR